MIRLWSLYDIIDINLHKIKSLKSARFRDFLVIGTTKKILVRKKMYFYTNAAFKANINHISISIFIDTYGIAL